MFIGSFFGILSLGKVNPNAIESVCGRSARFDLPAIDLRGLALLEINSAERPICKRIQTSAGFY
jgi:hypothetical protein